MKKKILFFVVLLMTSIQVFAWSIDTLSFIPGALSVIDVEGLNASRSTSGVNTFVPGGSSSASYPVLSVTPASRSIDNVLVGEKITVSFNLKGVNLTKPITLATVAETIGGEFTVYPHVLPASGGTVRVTYTPSKAGSSSAVITFVSGNKNVKFRVYGHAYSVIKTSKSSLHFSGNGSESFTVSCTGANSDLNLKLEGTGKSFFRLNKTTITKADAARGVPVSVICVPKNARRATAEITITGGGSKSPKTVYLSYTKNEDVMICSIEQPIEMTDGNQENCTIEPSMEIDCNLVSSVYEMSSKFDVYAEGRNIIIETSVPEEAFISDISGRVKRVKLQTGHNVIPVDATGIHLVRVGENVAKLMLR